VESRYFLRSTGHSQAERQDVYNSIAIIEQRIAEWDAYIAATMPLAQPDAHEFLEGKSVADLCRIALNAYGQWVTAQQVRGYLAQLGIRFQYNNEMAVLHNTLKRVGQTRRDSFGNTVYAPK
jgi:hypothetical protein